MGGREGGREGKKEGRREGGKEGRREREPFHDVSLVASQGRSGDDITETLVPLPDLGACRACSAVRI